jgi:hypothetical protein
MVRSQQKMCVPAQVNDGVEVEKAVSYTPVTFKILSLPPGLRGALGTIVMIALLPPKIKNYNSMFRPIVDMLVALAPEGAGISVDSRTVSLVVAWLLNDTRAVYTTAGPGKCPPAFVGSCVRCVVQGQRHLATTVLPGAVRLLPIGDPLRARYAEEFAAYRPLQMLADMPRCAKRTHASIIASGRRVMAGAPFKEEAFKGVSEYARLPYHNVAKHNVYDLAHALANMIKDMLKFLMVHLLCAASVPK